jgi:hypothetical protein
MNPRSTTPADARSLLHLVAPALALALTACGESARPAASPAAPPPPSAETQSLGPPSAASDAHGEVPTGAPSPAAAPPPPQAASEAIPSSMTAEVGAEMKKDEHDVATGDCPTACRALGSMERAVVFLCAANASAEDADRCAVARRHVTTARRRIRTTCGGCPGGPSVEPDAPIPSTR